MKKLIFLSFILILLVRLTGNSQTTVVRNSKLDSAQALIEKGKVCEKELANEKAITASSTKIIIEQDDTILEKDETIKAKDDIITDDKRKIKKRNKVIVGESGLLVLLLIFLL
jgi:hypothetical protein